MKLFTKAIEKKLTANANKPEAERVPVLKLFGGGACTWLISEKDGDTLFGLCDLDFGHQDKAQVIPDSLDNVGDVPAADKLWCAKGTVLAYLDGCYDD